MSIVVNKTRLPVTEWQTASGSVVSVNDARMRNAKSLSVALEPIQDLHGYDAPWVGGAGKNLAPFEDVLPDGYTKTERGVTVTVHNGVVHLEGVSESQTSWNILDFQTVWNISGISNYPISAGTYSIATGLTCRINGQNKGGTFTITETSYIRGFYIFVSASKYQQQVNQDIVLAITAGSTIPTSWTPYENLCPISGRSSVTAYRAGVDQSDNPQYVTVQLGQTVYDGTVDLVSGVMRVNSVLEVFDSVAQSGNIRSNIGLDYLGTSGSVDDLGDVVRISFAVDGNTSLYNRVSSGYAYKMCNMAKHYFAYYDTSAHWYRNNVLYVFLPKAVVGSTVTAVRDYLISIKDTTPLSLWIPLATPQTIQLTANQIEMLMRNNTIWSDDGIVTVNYARIR